MTSVGARPSSYRAAPTQQQLEAGQATLQKGHQGQSVQALQRQLNARGARLQVDGKFGAQTEAALRRFQASQGKAATGFADQSTFAPAQRRQTVLTPPAQAQGRPTQPAETPPAARPQQATHSQLAQLGQSAPAVRADGAAPVTPAQQRPPAARGYDVATTSAEQLAQLRRQGPEGQAMARTIEQARSTYRDLLSANPPAKLTVSQSPGNGKAPILTAVPGGHDPSKPTTVQTYYHGDRTSVAAPPGAESAHTHVIRESLQRDPQRVFVLPEARGNVGQNGTDWGNTVDQQRTTRDALASAGLGPGERHVVSAHSSGGRALATAFANNTVRADVLGLLDCQYDGAHARIRDGLQRAGNRVGQVQIVGPTMKQRNIDDMRNTFPGKVRVEQAISHRQHGIHAAAVRNHLVR